MQLIRIVKNWDMPDILRQTPKSEGVWGGVRFTLDDVDECDYLVVLNFVPKMTTVKMCPDNVWAFMQEPYVADRFPWVEDGHEPFGRVFTHHVFNQNSKVYVGTQTCLPWHINKSYDELVALELPIKNKEISWISSNKSFLPGHKKRLDFFHTISKDRKFNIDFFGRGISEIEDKYQALAPYKYSIAIENSRSEHYWTEKIADCFLSYTLPIYYGCTNLGDYFPSKSFVEIDINNYQESRQIIAAVLEDDIWEDRIDAIKEARELVLNKYQLFPFISDRIERSKEKFQAKENLTFDCF